MPKHLTSKNLSKYITHNTNAIIDFGATWCRPCKDMHPFFVKAEGFIQNTAFDFNFFEVDVDQSVNIAKEYNIKGMPTLVLIKDGKEVARRSGFMNDLGILTFIGTHFDLPQEERSEEGSEEVSSESYEVNHNENLKVPEKIYNNNSN